MTKSELKQKLEAVRDADVKAYAFRYCEGFNALLPLLLDAYAALEFYKDCTKDSFGDGNSYAEDDGAKAFKALARIEAFASGTGADETSVEFENGEK